MVMRMGDEDEDDEDDDEKQHTLGMMRSSVSNHHSISEHCFSYVASYRRRGDCKHVSEHDS